MERVLLKCVELLEDTSTVGKVEEMCGSANIGKVRIESLGGNQTLNTHGGESRFFPIQRNLEESVGGFRAAERMMEMKC